MHSPMATLPLRVPSPITIRKSYKSESRAIAAIKRKMSLGTLKTVSRCERRTVITFYVDSRRCNWHNWGFNDATNVEVRKQPAITYNISASVALARIVDTPKVVTALESDFAI